MDVNRKIEELEDSSCSDSDSEEEVGVDGMGGPLRPLRRGAQSAEPDTSDDDSSLSEGDMAQEEMDIDQDQLQAQLTQLTEQLLLQPYSYDLYLDKIRILKNLGDLDGLRATRQTMSDLYPLSPSLWIDWIKDEEKLITDDEEKERVITLMDRAVCDYSSVELWLEYINFWLSRLQEDQGEEKCRDVFEKALASCGLHVSMGSLIWDAYRDFEAALLATKITDDEMTEQEKRYLSLCKRQLSVPLLDMKNTYKQIKGRIDIDPNTEAAYSKAVQRLKDLQSLEAKLVQASDDFQKICAYKEYIEAEKKLKSNPARVQCLYERAVTDLPLEVSIWTEYIDYLSKSLKIPELMLRVAERASRNCPWIISIWTKYMWVVETFSAGNTEPIADKMKTVFEKAIVYCGTSDQAGTLWLKYLEFLRRAVNLNDPISKTVGILRNTFIAAEEHLLQLVEEPNDYLSQILQFKARFEANVKNSMSEEAQEIWKDIFHRGYGQYFSVWVQYISQLIKYGADVKKIRGELSRGMSYVRDYPNSMADLWLNFERDNGDLTSMVNCEIKISKELGKVALVTPDLTPPAKQYYINKETGKTEVAFVKGQKENRAQARKRKFEEPFNSGLAKKGRSADLEIVNKMDIVDGKDGGMGEIGEFKLPSIPPKPKFKQDEVNDKESVGKRGDPIKHDHSKDHRTVFVSNLDFKTNEEGLREFFSASGPIEEVRLVRDFKGKSKGFAYVLFQTEDPVNDALTKDRNLLDNRPVYVSKCDPNIATRQPQFKYPSVLEKSKIFVKGIPLSTTIEELKEIFVKFGPVKDCRLVTHRNGHSKGLAFIEFETEGGASAAILQMDGGKILDQIISVSISNPPSKTLPKTNTKFAPSRSEPDQRRSRNIFVPRVLHVQPSTTADGPSTGNSSKSKKTVDEKICGGTDTGPKTETKTEPSKSNDYFRKLFMKHE